MAGENFIGLCNSAGAIQGSMEIDSRLGTTNEVLKANLASPLTVSARLHWVAIPLNTTSTQAALLCMGNTNFTMFNGVQATAAQRFATNGTGLTALPPTITPASNTTTTGIAFWAAVG